jgi:hypothetical protein
VSFLSIFLLVLLGSTRARADISPPGCTGSGLGINLFTSSSDVHIGDTLAYSVTVFNGLAGTGRVVCDATAIVAGVVTPDGVTNYITLRRTSLSNGESDFYSNVVSYVVRAQDVRPDGTVRATAFDDGDIHQNDTNSRGGGDQGVNTQVSQPCIAISALCIGGMGENGAITFTGSLTNCGNSQLVGVTVTNAVNSGFSYVTFITNLAVGQVATFTGSWIPSDPCNPSSGVLTARAVDQFTATPRTVTASTTVVCKNTLTPGIRVTKTCPVGAVAPGQLLTFTGTVANTGDIRLDNIVIVNSQPVAGTPVFTRASLAPGEVVTFTGSYTAPTNCSVSDTLIATGTSACGGMVTHSTSTTCDLLTSPSLVVAALCPTGPIVPGGLLTYSGTVRNSGNIGLTNVTVVSDQPNPNTVVLTIASLAPGGTASFTGSRPVTTNGCTVTTTLTGAAHGLCSTNPVTHTISTTCIVTTAPALEITVGCPVDKATAGGLIVFEGRLRNSGNVTLTDILVRNTQNGTNALFRAATLAPGASVNFLAGFTAPMDACSVSTTVFGSGNDLCAGTPVSASASTTCELLTTPSILVTQACPTVPATPGSLVVYSGTVQNTGNITLTNVVLMNSLAGSNPVLVLTTLAPGAFTNFTASNIAPTNCSTASTTTAMGRSLCGIAVSDSVTTVCPVTTTPEITIVQSCPTGPIIPGGLLTYTGTVRNSGDITLTNITVRNNRDGTAPVLSLASLAPGASANFTGTYRIPIDCCTVSSTATATGSDSCTGRLVQDTATSTCLINSTPGMIVTKVCPAQPTAPGTVLRYTGTVSNTGDVTLMNVTVFNNRPIDDSPVFGPVTLAPGESASFAGSYTANANFCDTDTVTAHAMSMCDVPVTASVTTTCATMPTVPGIAVSRDCPLLPTPRGGLHTYTGTVSNTGDVTLVDVYVFNSKPTNGTPVIGPITLAPGASAAFTGSFTAPLDCCEITETVTARGQDRCAGTIVSAHSTDVCPMLTTPGLGLTQICSSQVVLPGGVFAFTGVITNTGDVNLTNVVVYSIRPGASRTAVFGPIELAPGESARFTASHPTGSSTNAEINLLEATAQDICMGRTLAARADCSGPVGAPPLPMLRTATQTNGVIAFVWDSSAGYTYTLQCKTALEDPIWIDVPGRVTANGNTASKTDVLGPTPRRFYRVILSE